jgi:hypothetical protein
MEREKKILYLCLCNVLVGTCTCGNMVAFLTVMLMFERRASGFWQNVTLPGIVQTI